MYAEGKRKMRQAYPVILSPGDDGYLVYSPDFDNYTHGKDLTEAIYMAKDAISLLGVGHQDMGKEIPVPGQKLAKMKKGDIMAVADVDFDEYRILNDSQKVNTMVTIRKGIKNLAIKRKMNLSQTLEEAILAKA